MSAEAVTPDDVTGTGGSDHAERLSRVARGSTLNLVGAGVSAVAAYNVTLLSSFVLCALAAHALAWSLTRSHAAGAVSERRNSSPTDSRCSGPTMRSAPSATAASYAAIASAGVLPES